LFSSFHKNPFNKISVPCPGGIPNPLQISAPGLVASFASPRFVNR
jgi:hypothetical protein